MGIDDSRKGNCVINNHYQVALTAVSLTMSPYHPLFLVSPLDGIQCLHRVDVDKSLLVGKH